MIRSDEVASSVPAERPRPQSARWRGLTVGVASLAAVLGTALVPALRPGGGSRELGHRRHRFEREQSSLPGRRGPRLRPRSAPPTWPTTPPTATRPWPRRRRAPSSSTSSPEASESNEYNIQTAPNPSPAFGSLTSGDAYLVAGTGTAGLIAQPGNNQFGNSTTAVATANPITPTSVAFDPSGNLLIAGENGTVSAIQVVAKTTGTFYGVVHDRRRPLHRRRRRCLGCAGLGHQHGRRGGTGQRHVRRPERQHRGGRR